MPELGQLIRRWYRQAQRVFHLLVALAFFCLAIAGGFVSIAEWRYYRWDPAVGPARVWLTAGFTVLLFILCLFSFSKARSVR